MYMQNQLLASGYGKWRKPEMFRQVQVLMNQVNEVSALSGAGDL